MAHVTISRTINAPRDQLWNIFAEIGKVAEFHPGIEASRTLNDKTGLGAMRACEFGNGKGVDEEVTSWKEGERMSFTATSFRKMPMHDMTGHFIFEGENPTTVTFTMDYRMNGGFIMNLMARGMMKKAGQGMLEGVESKL